MMMVTRHTQSSYPGAEVGGGPGECRAVAGGVDGAVGRTVQSAVDVGDVHERIQLLRLRWRQDMGLRVEGTT